MIARIKRRRGSHLPRVPSEDISVKYVVLAARLFIGGLFVYASMYKIMDPAEFAGAIRNYLILPAAWSNVVALTLPWIEVVAGALLVLGIQSRPAALLTTGMLTVFLGAVVYAYATGLDIDCGCFGSPESSGGRVGVAHIVRDLALVLVSFAVVLWDRGDFGLETMFRSKGASPSSL